MYLDEMKGQNMPSDEVMYKHARKVGEPAACRVLKKLGAKDVKQTGSEEDFGHVDIKCKFKDMVCYFDVKQQSGKWAGKSRCYNMSEDLLDTVKTCKLPREHWLMCELYGKNGKPDGRWFIASTYAVAAAGIVEEKTNRKTGKKFWQFSIDDCMDTVSKTKWKIVE